MTLVKSRKGVLNSYKEAPVQVQKFFAHLPKLLADLPLDVSLSYVFSQVELAQNLTLYCGIVKLHRADGTLARTAIDIHHMTRGDFKQKFQAVFDKGIPDRSAKPWKRLKRYAIGSCTASRQPRRRSDRHWSTCSNTHANSTNSSPR